MNSASFQAVGRAGIEKAAVESEVEQLQAHDGLNAVMFHEVTHADLGRFNHDAIKDPFADRLETFEVVAPIRAVAGDAGDYDQRHDPLQRANESV